MNALIGSGFYASSQSDFDKKVDFYMTKWLPNVGDRDVVIVDNSEAPVPKLESTGRVRVIEVMKNLGHVGDWVDKPERGVPPLLLGWSMSWILPAQIAYCEGRDFIYQESDCLAFGFWEKRIYQDAESKGLQMVFGDGSKWSSTEQSLMLIRHGFILEAIRLYMSILQPDSVLLPENKHELTERENPSKIGRHSLPGGRNRPIPFGAPAWYAQKFTDEELAQLKVLKIV